jgi:hypothetical protein
VSTPTFVFSADEDVAQGFLDPAVEGRSLAFTCTKLLAHDTTYTLKIGPEVHVPGLALPACRRPFLTKTLHTVSRQTPSTEGPLTSIEPHLVTFTTVPQFDVTRTPPPP